MRISDWSSDVCSSDLCGADRAFATCDEQAVVDQFAGRAAGMFDVGGVHAEAFAVIFEEGSRYGIKGTDLTFNEIGVVREVDPRFGLVDLGCISNTFLRLGDGRLRVQVLQYFKHQARACP